MAHYNTTSARVVASMEDPISALAKSVERIRISAPRPRYQAIQAMSKWFMHITGQPMTRQVGNLLEYYHAIAEEPCGRTVTNARLGAFVVF